METLTKIPDNYEEHSESVMSNYDHEIDRGVEKLLKEKELYAQYAGWNFCGQVWWDKENNEWSCEVWRYSSHVETVSAETLEEIMEEVFEKYGAD